jgi:hypothetical protein
MVVVSSQAKTHNTLHSQPIVLWSVEWVYKVVVCQQEFSMMNGLFSITPTTEAMNSGRLRVSFLSTNTNVGAGDKTPNYLLHPPLFITFVGVSLIFILLIN